MRNSSSLVLTFLILTLLANCTGQGISFIPAIPGYNASEKQQLVLDKELLEISGMFYLENGDLAAINDEEGKIFFVNSTSGDFEVMRFGKKRDYEDVAKAGNFYYVLESNGNIHRVPVGSEGTEEEFEFSREKKIEFESLYYDKPAEKLVLISKEQRESKDVILAFAFNLSGNNFLDTPYYTISMDEVRFSMKDNIAEFKPSAAAIHPVLQKLFIIASIGKSLLQCSKNGKVEKVYKLNPDQFPQPEGITFAPNGDMFISNEGVNGKGTILKFPYRK